MSAVAAPPAALTATARSRSGRVVLVLARIEGRRLIRRPIFLFGEVIGVAILLVATWSEAPVMHRDDIVVVLSMLPIAVTTYLLSNLAVTRARRNATEELYEAAPTQAVARTTAHLLAIAWPLAVSLVMTIGAIGFLKASGGVWSPSLQELATGPAIVLMLGAWGVFVGRVVPSAIAGTVGLIGLSAVQLFFMQLEPTAHGVRRWVAFWLDLDQYIPRELVFRPAGWHLIYLAGLATLGIAAARLRHGPTVGRLTAGVAALALAATGISGQSRPENRPRQLQAGKVIPREPVVCETHDGVRYCAYRAYAPWISRWRDVVSSVFASVPTSPRPGFAIEQSLASLYEEANSTVEDEPGLVRTNALWGHRFNAGVAAMSVATKAAAWAVGLPAGARQVPVLWTEESIRAYISEAGGKLPADHEVLRPGNEKFRGPCHTIGQARAIVALWLAGQSSPGAANFLRASAANQPYGLSRTEPGEVDVVGESGQTFSQTLQLGAPTHSLYPWPYGGEYQSLEWGMAEAHYAVRLLERPADEVERILSSHWAALTSPAAKTESALSILGLDRLPSVEEQLRALRISPEDAIRSVYGGWTEPEKLAATLAMGIGALTQEYPGAPCP